MANVKISELTAGGALSGSEFVPIVQNGATVKTTTQAIADLGGGGGGPVDVSPIKGFFESGINANNWRSTDDSTDITRQSGTYTPTVGQYVEVNATNACLLRFNVIGSYYMFGIKCQIDPNFTPVNTNNWYQASCLLGQEIGGQQRDFGIIIDKNGFFALGWANSNITSSTISALDGEIHTLFVIADDTSIHLFIDGNEEITETITMSGTQFWSVGVMYNGDNANTRVNGKIYRVGYFSAVKVNGNYVVPDWEA